MSINHYKQGVLLTRAVFLVSKVELSRSIATELWLSDINAVNPYGTVKWEMQYFLVWKRAVFQFNFPLTDNTEADGLIAPYVMLSNWKIQRINFS